MYRQNNNYTSINELPELDDLELQESPSILNESQQQKYGKFIRTNYEPPLESGMNYRQKQTSIESLERQSTPINRVLIEEKFTNSNDFSGVAAGAAPFHGSREELRSPEKFDYSNRLYNEQEQTNDNGVKTYNMPENSPSCLSVAEHIANCPICSKFYKNDNIMFIGAIGVLVVVICLLVYKMLSEPRK